MNNKYTIEQLEEMPPKELGLILLYGIMFGLDIQYLKNIINAGADLEVLDRYNSTPLKYAAANGYVEAVKALIAAGASLEARAAYGDTALHHAAFHDCTKVVKVLIAAGADLHIRDGNNKTPWDLARPITKIRCPELKP